MATTKLTRAKISSLRLHVKTVKNRKQNLLNSVVKKVESLAR